MYIENIPNRNSPPAILLREAYRQDGRILKRTLANLSKWPPHLVEGLRVLLKGGTAVESLETAFDVSRSLPHGHVAAVLGTLHKIGLDRIIEHRDSRQRRLVIAIIVSRIIDPGSKLATARGLSEETAFNSLSEELELGAVDEDDLYEAMDWLFKRQAEIEGALSKRHLQNGSLVLYDVSSTYFEGHSCPLAQNGYSRDGKGDHLQIVFGLLCNAEGCPVAVEVFEGNTGDPSTLTSQLQKVKERFGIDRIIWVGDRGMITEARINEEMRGVEGLQWITALRSSAIRNLVVEGALQQSFFEQRDLAEIQHPDYPGERLIACRNPLMADRRARKREDLLRATERELDKIVEAVKRLKRPLRGKDLIGIRVGKIIGKYKMAKHFQIQITDESFFYKRDAARIVEEESLDGIYVIRTSVADEVLDTESTVGAYKRLSVVERAFRSCKTVDLKVRPIYHHLPDRVRTHVFLCMLAYYVEWHMRQRLAPILFDDDDRAGGEALRESIVSPAQRSPSAMKKTTTKRTEGGMPVHSFQTLLEDLATIAKDHVEPKLIGASSFCKITRPTPIQKKALDLLGVKLHCTQ
jgi:hypothetical protein